jgi:tetratricopeptide (TPR) repeat protein
MPIDNEIFWLQKCIEAFRNSDYDSLLKNAEELEKNSKDRFTPVMYKGIAYFHKKMFNDACKVFYWLYLKKFSKEKNEDDGLLYYLALCSIYKNDTARAISLMEKLKKKHPENADYRLMHDLALKLNGGAISAFQLRKTIDHRDLSGTAKVLLEELLKNLKH